MGKRHFSSSVHTVFQRNSCVEAKRTWQHQTKIETNRIHTHTHAHRDNVQHGLEECSRTICYFVFGCFASYRCRIAQRISCDRFVSIFGSIVQYMYIHNQSTSLPPLSYFCHRALSFYRFNTKYHTAMLAANQLWVMWMWLYIQP